MFGGISDGPWSSLRFRSSRALIAFGVALACAEARVGVTDETDEPALAGNLNNLGIRYSNLGRQEEALAASERALEIYERLTARHSDAYEPDLATSLRSMAGCLEAVGRKEEAEAAWVRARDIRKLRESRQRRWPPNYVTAIRRPRKCARCLHRSRAPCAHTVHRRGAKKDHRSPECSAGIGALHRERAPAGGVGRASPEGPMTSSTTEHG